MIRLDNLNFTSPVLDSGSVPGSKIIKATDPGAGVIINSFKEKKQIIISAHLESIINGKKIEPKLVLDTMYLNPDLSIDLDDENKGFEITAGGLIESNNSPDIKVNVLGPLKSLLSVAEVKQGSAVSLQPSGDVTASASDISRQGYQTIGQGEADRLLENEEIATPIINQTPPANNRYIGPLPVPASYDPNSRIQAIPAPGSNVSANRKSRISAAASGFGSGVGSLIGTGAKIMGLNGGGSTRRRKYKKRTTRRNKRRTYRYKK